jgi:hypothetical protein
MSRRTKTIVIGKARYNKMGKPEEPEYEAVYRMQEAQNEKTCSLEGCPLGGRILPMMRYARVFYRDTHEVEVFHKGCFTLEFGRDSER